MTCQVESSTLFMNEACTLWKPRHARTAARLSHSSAITVNILKGPAHPHRYRQLLRLIRPLVRWKSGGAMMGHHK